MRAAVVGDDGAVSWGDAPAPEPGPGEVGLAVVATALNRADLAQRRGQYPPPPGASPILGLEASGVIASIGEGVTGWRVGDAACALLAGGGNAELVCVPAEHLMPIPAGVDPVAAAALPEVFATAWANLRGEAGLAPCERVLIHAGASGVGTAAVQLCRALRNPCFVTAGSDAKIARCVALGADGGAVRHGDWEAAARAWAGGGVDVILDPVGGAYLAANQRLLATDGRLVLIGLLGGRAAPLDLGRMLVKRQRLIGSTLRSRSPAYKAAVCRALVAEVWPRIERGEIAPIIDRVLPAERIADGHAALERDETVGKIVLLVQGT